MNYNILYNDIYSIVSIKCFKKGRREREGEREGIGCTLVVEWWWKLVVPRPHPPLHPGHSPLSLKLITPLLRHPIISHFHYFFFSNSITVFTISFYATTTPFFICLLLSINYEQYSSPTSLLKLIFILELNSLSLSLCSLHQLLVLDLLLFTATLALTPSKVVRLISSLLLFN